MKITFGPKRTGYDHVIAYADGRSFGYRGLKSDVVCVERCPVCDRKNYCMAVSSGFCSWCGWNAKREKVQQRKGGEGNG